MTGTYCTYSTLFHRPLLQAVADREGRAQICVTSFNNDFLTKCCESFQAVMIQIWCQYFWALLLQRYSRRKERTGERERELFCLGDSRGEKRARQWLFLLPFVLTSKSPVEACKGQTVSWCNFCFELFLVQPFGMN